MEFKSTINEPLDLSVAGNLKYSLYPSQHHVPGLAPSSVWTRLCQREVPRTQLSRRFSTSPKLTDDQCQVTIKSEPITSLHGFYPYMPVTYPLASHQVGIPQQYPDWIPYPSPPEERSILQVNESVSPRRASVSPQLGEVEDDQLSSDPEFQNFRNEAVRALAERNGGQLVGHNPRMRRSVQPSQEAGDEYRRQRARNNFAAKQSRDRRKLREIEASLKVCFLQRKLDEMRAKLAAKQCGHCQRPCR